MEKFLTLLLLFSISAIIVAQPADAAKKQSADVSRVQYANAAKTEPVDVERRLYDLEHKVEIIDNNQLNYQIEKDLLKETYSNNYEKISLGIALVGVIATLVLGIMGAMGYLGLRDIGTIKKEYEHELRELSDIKNKFEFKSDDFDSKREKLDRELKSIIDENQKQSQKIKLIELKEKISSLIKNGKHSLALEFCNAALEIEPNNPVILNDKGRVLFRLNQATDAINAYRKALDENPDYSYSIFNLVECLYFSNKIEKAKEIINENKAIFKEKYSGKLIEFLELIELYFNSDKDKLIEAAKSYVTVDNLVVKEKTMEGGWDLAEAKYFAVFQSDGELKNIIQNIIWYWDGQSSGKELLTSLGIPLPSSD